MKIWLWVFELVVLALVQAASNLPVDDSGSIPAAPIHPPIWKLDFRSNPYASISSSADYQTRRFSGDELTEDQIPYEMSALTNRTGFSFVLEFSLALSNLCGAPEAVEQFILVGSTAPTVASSLAIWIDPTDCRVCFGTGGSAQPVCSQEPVSKATLHTVVGSYTPGGSAELWIDGENAASITAVTWILRSEKIVFVGGQPGGEQGSWFVGQLGLIELYDYPMSSLQVDQSASVCGDGRVMKRFEQCDDGNMIMGDGCSLKTSYSTGSCDEHMVRGSTASLLPDRDQCEAKCSVDDECTTFVFDQHSSTCYTFVEHLPGDSVLPTWSNLGPGCCGFGAVLQNKTVKTSSPGNMLRECKQFCEQSADCGFINFGWTADNVPSGVCMVFRTGASECAPPLTTDGLMCGGGWEATHTGDRGVHTYKYVKPSHVCHTKDPSKRICAVETGWDCHGGSKSQPDRCSPLCGDGLLVGHEECDDGNTASSDGCSAECKIEAGWSCNADVPSVCEPICGDGRLQAHEICDDGNQLPGDGCSAKCLPEPGWKCTTSEPTVCDSVPTTMTIPYTSHVQMFSLILSWALPVRLGSTVTQFTIITNGVKYSSLEVNKATETWLMIPNLQPSSKLRLQVTASNMMSTTKPSIATTTTLNHMAPVYSIGGGGWKLVRHVAPPLSIQATPEWHQARDGLSGSGQYGDASDDPRSTRSFSIEFKNTQFQEYLFATGDGAHWAIIGRDAFHSQEACNPSEVVSFLGKSLTFCQTKDRLHQPRVVIKGINEQEYVLYEEGSKLDQDSMLRRHFGANVFIRQGIGEVNDCQGAVEGDCHKFASSTGFTGSKPKTESDVPGAGFAIRANELGLPTV